MVPIRCRAISSVMRARTLAGSRINMRSTSSRPVCGLIFALSSGRSRRNS
jgi:hypothetical protein